jgi:Rod binding domain-containing protein
MSPITAISRMAMSQASATPTAADCPERIHDAAEQFEALLLAQLLKWSHTEGGGWMGLGSDPSGSCASDYAEQQLAVTLAQKGGLGLSKLIAQGLSANR